MKKAKIRITIRKDYLKLIDDFSKAVHMTRDQGIEIILYAGFLKANEMIDEMVLNKKLTEAENGTEKTER